VVLLAACGSDNSSSSSAKTTAAAAAATSAGGTNTTAAASAKSYPAIPAGPIKFAIETPVSGVNAPFGLATQKAFQRTEKEFARLHPDGIDGHPVQFVVYDDGSDVTKAVGAANQIVSDKVAAVVTVSTSPQTTDQEMAVFGKNKIPVVAYPGGNQYADVSKWPYLFQVTGNSLKYAQAAAAWFGKHPEIKKISVLTDNVPSSTELLDNLKAAMKTTAPNTQIGDTVAITPGSVDVSTAIAQLKATNPDMLYVNIGYGYGPVWNAIQTAGWSPKIFVGAGVWYDGFSGMGPLATNAVTSYLDCVKPGHPPFPATLTSLLDAYAQTMGSDSVNYLTYVNSDIVSPELLKLAIEKHHSVDPDAIKDAMETLGPTTIYDAFQFNYSATDHANVQGDYGPAMCTVSPLGDGAYRIPTIAP
jgi:branched-chain amino acid transport system substrate-binding protein